MTRQIYICTVTAPSEMENAVSKKPIKNGFNNHFLCLTFKNKYLIRFLKYIFVLSDPKLHFTIQYNPIEASDICPHKSQWSCLFSCYILWKKRRLIYLSVRAGKPSEILTCWKNKFFRSIENGRISKEQPGRGGQKTHPRVFLYRTT